MGLLWYLGHTICVSQGLTLSTASLVITVSDVMCTMQGTLKGGLLGGLEGELKGEQKGKL